jgi:hypothetical protein
MKWIWSLLIGGGAFFAFFIVSHDQSLRFAQLIPLEHALKNAQAEYKLGGAITNQPTSSVQITLSTNSILIDSTNYQIFAVARGSYTPESAVAVTTNNIFILLEPHSAPRVISPGYRPRFFSRGL